MSPIVSVDQVVAVLFGATTAASFESVDLEVFVVIKDLKNISLDDLASGTWPLEPNHPFPDFEAVDEKSAIMLIDESKEADGGHRRRGCSFKIAGWSLLILVLVISALLLGVEPVVRLIGAIRCAV